MNKFINLQIVTIVKNDDSNLLLTLESVRKSDPVASIKIRHLIVNGSSSELSASLLSKIREDSNTTYIWSPDNGIYEGMNNALRKIDLGFVMFLNAGDEFQDRDSLIRIEKTIISKPEIKVFQFQIMARNEIKPKKKYGFIELLLGLNMHAHPGFIINREYFENLFFDEKYRIAADYKFVLQVLRHEIATDRDYEFVNFPIVSFQGGGISEIDWRGTVSEMNQVRLEICKSRIAKILMKVWNIKVSLSYSYKVKRASSD